MESLPGLKQLHGIEHVTIRRDKKVTFIITKPDVYVSPSSGTYVIFGEARVSFNSETPLSYVSPIATTVCISVCKRYALRQNGTR